MTRGPSPFRSVTPDGRPRTNRDGSSASDVSA